MRFSRVASATLITAASVAGFAGSAFVADGVSVNDVSETKTASLVGVARCTNQATGTWAVDWTLTTQLDGAGVDVLSQSPAAGFATFSDTGTLNGATANLTAASATQAVTFQLENDVQMYWYDLDDNGEVNWLDVENPLNEVLVELPAGLTVEQQALVTEVQWPQVTLSETVAKPAGCVATPTTGGTTGGTTSGGTTTGGTTTGATTTPVVAGNTATQGTTLPATGLETNQIAAIAGLALIGGLGFIRASRKRPQAI